MNATVQDECYNGCPEDDACYACWERKIRALAAEVKRLRAEIAMRSPDPELEALAKDLFAKSPPQWPWLKKGGSA